MYEVTHIVTSVKNPKDRSFIIKDENGNLYTGEPEPIGFLWKVGNQFFDYEGHEVKKPDFISTIDSHICPKSRYSETRDVFYATSTKGEKIIVRTEYFDKDGSSMSAFRIDRGDLKEYPDVRFVLYEDKFEIVPFNLKGTFMEEWVKTTYDMKNIDGWELVKNHIGYSIMSIPRMYRLGFHFFWNRDLALVGCKPAKTVIEMQYEAERCAKEYFRELPEFYDDPKYGKSMKLGNYRIDIELAKQLHSEVLHFYGPL